jgi:hypothetical protein
MLNNKSCVRGMLAALIAGTVSAAWNSSTGERRMTGADQAWSHVTVAAAMTLRVR